MAGPRLGPVLGSGGSGDGLPGGTQLFDGRRVDGFGPLLSCATLRLEKLSGASAKPSKAPHRVEPRGRNPGTQCFREKSKEVKGLERNCVVDGPAYSSFISPRDDPKMARFGLEHSITDIDVCGRTFLLDKKWTNDRTDYKYDFRERRISKPNSFIPPLPRDYQVYRSNHINRFSLHKEFSHSPPKPFPPGSYEGYDLTPGVVLPAATHAFGGKPGSITEPHTHRPRINNQASGLFRICANKKPHAYVDPVCGASASFVQRLSEMTSLEGETIRQENLKKLKRTKRLES